MSMTDAEWMAEVRSRIVDNEGQRLYKYLDSRGIVTLGDGFNMERGDAEEAMKAIGADWESVKAAPVAVDSAPANAVAPCITQEQANALFAYSFKPVISDARASLAPGVYDFLSDARRFVICDLVFNLGDDGWLEFAQTRALINQAQQAKDREDTVAAHVLFRQAANHLLQSAYARQVGNRAKRNAAMLATSVWADAEGDGSDVL